jgi:hypothetical protein
VIAKGIGTELWRDSGLFDKPSLNPRALGIDKMLARAAQVPALKAVLYGEEAGFVSEKQGAVLKACKPHWKTTVSRAPP